MSKSKKIQQLFVTQLIKEGHVQITLPNEMTLEVGITQEDGNGDLKKEPNYCWVLASQNGRTIAIDEYNLGIKYTDVDKNKFVIETTSGNEEDVKFLEVI